MSNYIVHKAVELSKVKKKRQAVLSQPNYLEENYLAQPKYDGCNMVCIVDCNADDELCIEFRSRTDEFVLSCDHIEAAMRAWPMLAEGVYLGEAWCPDADFAEISGWFRTQSTTPDTCRLQFVIFDVLTLDEWDSGHSDVPYENRAARLGDITHIPQCQAPFWSAGGFGNIAKAWTNTTAQDVCDKLVAAGGYDGLILRDPQGTWTRGDSGTGGEIIKLKRKLSYDLRVTGVEEGLGKNAGRVGALVCSFKGQELRVGTGFSDAERWGWWDTPDRIIGKIIEVEAMDYSKDGLLREPRMKGIRHDKLEADA
jgi:DNA ligase-1